MRVRRRDLEAVLLPSEQVEQDGWWWGTVTSVSPLRVRRDGEDDPLPITPDAMTDGLQVDDRVRCHRSGSALVIQGRSTRAGLVPAHTHPWADIGDGAPLPVGLGGTAATTSAGARDALGAASAGDLTALTERVGALETPARGAGFRSGSGTFASGSMTSILAVTVPVGPTGTYRVTVTFVFAQSVAGTVYLRCRSSDGANTLVPDVPMRLTAGNLDGTYTVTRHWSRTTTAATNFTLYLQASAGTGSAPAGSALDFEWIGA